MSQSQNKTGIDITLTPSQTFFILIEKILGKGTSRALEYHLLKVLGKQNLEEAITTNPVKLYEERISLTREDYCTFLSIMIKRIGWLSCSNWKHLLVESFKNGFLSAEYITS